MWVAKDSTSARSWEEMRMVGAGGVGGDGLAGEQGFVAGEGTGADALHEGVDELVADEGVEAGEGLVEEDDLGAVGQDGGKSGLHEHAAGEVLELAVEGELKLLDEGGVVPGGGRSL